MTDMPAPPYSFGQAGATQPRVASFFEPAQVARVLADADAEDRVVGAGACPAGSSVLMKSRTSGAKRCFVGLVAEVHALAHQLHDARIAIDRDLLAVRNDLLSRCRSRRRQECRTRAR